MSERNYKRKYEFQKEMITRQSKQIDYLKSQISDLKSECIQKDEMIKSVDSLKNELTENIKEIESKKEEYENLLNDLRMMKKIMDDTVFKGRWKLIKILMK